MNWLDFVIIAVVVWFTLVGLSTGLVRQAVTLLAATLGVFLAGHYYQKLADDIAIVHSGDLANRLIAFVAIFSACVLAGQLAGIALRDLVALLFLGPLDRAGGFVFGAIQGVVIVELLLIACATFPAAQWMTKAIDTSLLTPVFLSGLPWLLHLLPSSFRQAVAGF